MSSTTETPSAESAPVADDTPVVTESTPTPDDTPVVAETPAPQSQLAAPASPAVVDAESSAIADENEKSIAVAADEYATIAIDEAMAIVAHNVFSILIPNAEFRESVVRYLKGTRNQSASASIFMQMCVTHWTAVRQVSLDSPDSNGLFDTNIVEAARSRLGSDSIILVVDFTPPELQSFLLRYLTIVSLGRSKAGGYEPLDGETYEQSVARQVRESKLSVAYGTFDIAKVTTWSMTRHESLKAMVKHAFNRRLAAGNAFAATQFLGDIREACVRYNVHHKIIDPDNEVAALAVKTAEPKTIPPWECVRVYCGGHVDGGVHVLSQPQVEQMIADLRTKVKEDDQLLCAYKEVAAIMKTPRNPNEAAVMVVRGLYGACASYVVCHTSIMDMKIIGEGAEKERVDRLKLIEDDKKKYAELTKSSGGKKKK